MTRALSADCCPKCQGTGVRSGEPMYLGAGSYAVPAVPCDHSTRTDVTGLDDDTERMLALDRELDAMRERFRRYGKHSSACLLRAMEAAGDGRESPGCSCGFAEEWRRVFGTSKGVDSGHG